jgi:RNA polymerase sigma-70 factor (ECF subfamily)
MRGVSSDEELMAAYIAGDAQAFHTLFQRYAPILLRVMARQLDAPSEAHDLVQQTFLQLHRARYDFQPGAKLRPWLFTIALNLKREHFRRLRRRRETGLSLDGSRDPAVEPRGVEASDARQALRHALDQLPADQREVIELHWFDGLSFAEVGEVVGASLSAVKVRAHRGYRRMRELIEPSGASNPGQTIDIPDPARKS